MNILNGFRPKEWRIKGINNTMRILLLLLIIAVLGCTSSNKQGYKYNYRGISFKDKATYKRAMKYKPIDFNYPLRNFVALPNNENIFMSKYELSKGEYDTFLNDVLSRNSDLYTESAIDYSAWEKAPHFGSVSWDFMVSSYRHIAYNKRPVVNITYQGALNYCQWATQQIKNNDKKKIIIVRLPTEVEYDALVSHYQISVQTDTVVHKNGNEYNVNANLIYLINNLNVGEIQEAPMILDRSFIQTNVYMHSQTEDEHCSIIGNISEMTAENRVYGGNWYTLSNELSKPLSYTYPDPRIGFRLVLEILN